LRINVLLFASYADYTGRERLDWTLEAPATVAEVIAGIRSEIPGADRIPARPLVALNRIQTRLEAAVQDGDELALLPPMAGG
jgi:sulfur-carrier protein